MQGDPQLFGAEPGRVQHATVNVTPPLNGDWGRVHIECKAEGRAKPYQLIVQGLTSEQMATTVGYIVPLFLKSHYVDAATMKRSFWAAFRQLGIAGREVAIKDCGRPPKH